MCLTMWFMWFTLYASQTEGILRMLEKMNTQITTQVMTVTPATAAEWLANNPNNRKLAKHVISEYASAIRNGDWSLNGESIKISVGGELLDGQHRLSAIVRAKAPIQSIVIMGLPDDVINTVDVGKKRTTSDIFSMGRIKYSPQVSGTVTILFNIENGYKFQSKVTTLNAQRYLADHPEVADSVAFTQVNKGALKWRPQFGAAHALFSRKSREAADDFFVRLSTGTGLSANEGVYRLREKLIMEDHNKKKSARVDIMVWFIKAWNADRAGTPLTKLHGSSKDAQGATAIPSVE